MEPINGVHHQCDFPLSPVQKREVMRGMRGLLRLNLFLYARLIYGLARVRVRAFALHCIASHLHHDMT